MDDIILDFDGWRAGQPQEFQDSYQSWLDLHPVEERANASKRFATQLHFGATHGLSGLDVSENWDIYRKGYAEQQAAQGDGSTDYAWEAAADDDDAYYSKLHTEATTRKDRREWKATAAREARKAGLVGNNPMDAWEQVRQGSPFASEPGALESFLEVFNPAASARQGFRGNMAAAAERLKNSDTEGAFKEINAAGLDDFRRVGVEMLYAHLEENNDPKTVRSLLARMDLGAQRAGSAMFERLGDALGGASDKDNAIRGMLRSIRDSEADPIASTLAKGSVGQIVEDGLIGLAGSVPGMVAMAIPYAGIAGNYAQYHDSTRADLLLKHPDMKFEDADNIAMVAAAPMAALDKLELGMLKGNFGRLNDLFKTRTLGATGRFAAGAAGGVAFENVQEGVQDWLPLATQEIFHAVKEEIPDADWRGFEFFRPETFVATLPLALIGAGANVAKTHVGFRDIYAPEALALVGIQPEAAVAIQQAPTKEAATEMFRQAWENRTPPPPEAVKQIEANQEAATQMQAEVEKEAGVTNVSRSKDGWTVTTKEGKATTVGTAEAAGALVDQLHLSAAQEEANAYTEWAERWTSKEKLAGIEAERTISTGGELAKATTDGIVYEKDGEVTRVKDDAQTIKNLYAEAIALGIQPEENAVMGAILGSNVVEFQKTTRETAARFIQAVEINQTPSALLTAAHETAEANFRALVASGALTEQEAGQAITSIAPFLAVGFDTDGNLTQRLTSISKGKASQAELRETVSELAVAEVFGGRDKDGRRTITPGSISAAIRTALRAQGQATGLRKLAAMIRAAKTVFRAVFRTAASLERARRNGADFSKFDSLMDAVLERTDERQHAEAVAEEVEDIYGAAEYLPPSQEDMDNGIAFSLAPLADARYLELARDPEGNREALQRMVDEAAKKAGYHTRAKHGTAEKFTKFDQRQGGRMTQATSAKRAFFLTNDERTANSYAVYAAEDGPIRSAMDRADQAEAKGDWDGYDAAILEAESLDTSEARYKRRENVRIIDAYLSGDYFEFDAEGKTPQELHDDDIDAGITAQILKAKMLGKDGVIYRNLDDAINLAGRPATHYAVFRPSQIKSADPVTYDEAGEIIPLSQRFNAKSDDINFSLAPAAILESLAANLARRQRDPRQRVNMFKAAGERIGKLKANWTTDRQALIGGEDRTIAAMGEKLTESELKTRRAWHERFYTSQLEEQYLAEAQQEQDTLLNAEFLTKPTAYPVLNAVMGSGLNGLIMSRTRAMQTGKAESQHWDYDGAQGIPRRVFGGNMMPDRVAQQLFDDGFIADAHVDTMWEAIRKEAGSMADWKARASQAEQAISAAKARAKTEAKAQADAWAAAQTERQAKDWNPKAVLLRHMRTLDAILTSFPPEVRAKVGGFIALAKLTTPEAMAAEIDRRVEMLDKHLEKTLRDSAHDAMEKMVEQAKPKKGKPGEKPKGHLGATTHQLMDAVASLLSMNAQQAEAFAAGLQSELDADIEPTAEREAYLTGAIGLADIMGGWGELSAAERWNAVSSVERIYMSGGSEWAIKTARIRERRQAKRATLREDTGKDGHGIEKDIARSESLTKKGKLKQFLLSLSSFEQIARHAFGADSIEAKRLVSEERAASEAYEDEWQAIADGVTSLFVRLSGARSRIGSLIGLGQVSGQKLRLKLSAPDTVKIKDASPRSTRSLSELEAVQATLMWQQEDGKRHLKGWEAHDGKPASSWKYTQEHMDQIEAQLSPEAKAVRSYLRENYATEWAEINPLFEARHGISLPYHALYAPMTVSPTKEDLAKGTVDPITGQSSNGTSYTPGWAKTRSRVAMAEPDFKDALQVFLGHKRQVAHWKAYYDFSVEAAAVLGNRDVMNSVKAKTSGETANVLAKWIKAFAEGGVRDSAAGLAVHKAMQGAVGNLQSAALIGRTSVLAVQATQLAAASLEMPVGAYTKRLGKLLTGQLGWAEAKNSAFIQRRIATQPAVIQQAMKSLMETTEPSLIKHWQRRLGDLIGATDALFTAGTYAILFDYYRSQGMDEATARAKAETSTERVAQPSRMATKSLAEVTATHPLARMSWAFASEARQKIAIVAWAAADMDAGNWAEASKKIFVGWIGLGLASAAIKAAARDMFNDDDDEPMDWWRFLEDVAWGPLNGIPLLSSLMGQSRAGTAAAAGAVWDLVTLDFADSDEPAESFAKKVDAVFMAASAFHPTLSALSSLTHVAKDAVMLADGLRTDEEEKGLQQLKKEAREEKAEREAKEAAETKEQKAAEEAQKKAKRADDLKRAAKRAE